eukprot:TRINITY_DN6248_c0_g1_i2.p1 TRINITY_DN6248_c0_g1~~TRINITY_DN6248_c0_g1_i2.p1  ORF type:complete len:182 (-),score=58.90 TRINITY_DN6248_c0_g1_i2:4-504(-)
MLSVTKGFISKVSLAPLSCQFSSTSAPSASGSASTTSKFQKHPLADGILFTHKSATDVFQLVQLKQLDVKLQQEREKRNREQNLTVPEMAQIKDLREQDPYYWSQKRLAKKFNTSGVTIGKLVPVPPTKLKGGKQNLRRLVKRYSVRELDLKELKEKNLVNPQETP